MLGRSLLSLFITVSGLLLCASAALAVLVLAENTPLPDRYNPLKPLVVTDPETVLSQWKLARALRNGPACLAALAPFGDAKAGPDIADSDQCGIKDQVTLTRLGSSRISPVDTRCQTALRWAMWHQHGLNPAARDIFGQQIAQTTHFSSYNCRPIRTAGGETTRMSTHATAEAIDISGFVLSNGRRITLQTGWDGTPQEQAFLRRARNSACTWFKVTLGPDYNALHADHFHLQHTGWGLCR